MIREIWTNYWPTFRRGYFRIQDFYSVPYKQKLSYWQFCNSDDIHIKIEPGTKLSKEYSDDDVICDVIVTFAMYLLIWSNPKAGSERLIHSPNNSGLGIQKIPEACSAKFRFSLRVTFSLQKTGNRTKKSVTQLWYYCFE